jgi:Putative auto-transporter adhesin, head GIN domain
MKRTVIASAFLLVLPGTLAFADVRTLDVRDFSEVGVGSGMRVFLAQGERYGVEATSVQPDRLGARVGRIELKITAPMLRKLSLSGGTQGYLNQFTVARFSADLSGGSQLKGQLNAGDMDLNLSGGSRIELSGAGKQLNLEGSGGSGLEAKNLSITGLRTNLSGGSWAVVNMNGELGAQLSGGSRVTYYGNAVLGSIGASGGSKVQKGT